MFGPTGENLTDSQVKYDIMMMQDTSEEAAKHSSISEDMIKTVNFWHEAMTGTNQEHCNIGYMEDLYLEIKHISSPPTPNLVTLYGLVFENLKNVCSRPHKDLRDALNLRFNNSAKVDLMEIRNQYAMYRIGQVSEKKLSAKLFKRFGVYTTCSKDKIISAWENGPCGQLKAQVEQLASPSFEDFVDLVNYERVTTNETDDFSPEFWAKALYACKKSDAMIPDLAKNNDLTTVTCRKIAKGMDNLGYSYAVAHSLKEPPPPPSHMQQSW